MKNIVVFTTKNTYICDMTKKEAREILGRWVETKTKNDLGERVDMEFPVKDEIVFSVIDPNKGYECWTFIGLIKLAYDLEEKI